MFKSGDVVILEVVMENNTCIHLGETATLTWSYEKSKDSVEITRWMINTVNHTANSTNENSVMGFDSQNKTWFSNIYNGSSDMHVTTTNVVVKIYGMKKEYSNSYLLEAVVHGTRASKSPPIKLTYCGELQKLRHN